MANKGSSLWKFLSLLLLLAAVALAALWQWSEHRGAEQVAQVEEEAAEQLAARDVEHAAAVGALSVTTAETVARAFTSGIKPAVLAADRSSVDAAIGDLLQISEVDFVHVLSAEGGVFATSDRKVAETGGAGALGDWARSADTFTSRAGAAAGVTEVAVPIQGAGARLAVAVVGYHTGALTSPAAAAEPMAEPEPADEEDTADGEPAGV
ncbi:MAG: hypothetical protein SX243_14385 [Acidobacteriota bacterium]|nr:hypothetical protein [Acidobacteriota bacterium]